MKNNRNVLLDAFNKLIKTIEKTEKFVLAQAPEICKQIINEEIIDVTIELIAASFILIVLISFSVIIIHCTGLTHLGAILGTSPVDYTRCDPLGPILGIVFISLFMILPLIIVVEGTKKLLVLRFCPKLFLLNKFRKLLK